MDPPKMVAALSDAERVGSRCVHKTKWARVKGRLVVRYKLSGLAYERLVCQKGVKRIAYIDEKILKSLREMPMGSSRAENGEGLKKENSLEIAQSGMVVI